MTLLPEQIDLCDYEVVRPQFFNTLARIAVTFYPKKVRFSSNCIRRFSATEYVELQIHPGKNQVAVKPSNSDVRTAVKWARSRGGKLCVREFSGKAFLGVVYAIFGWNPALRYRLHGEIRESVGERYAVFNVSEAEIIIPRGAVADIPSEYNFCATNNRYTDLATPSYWGASFGRKFSEVNAPTGVRSKAKRVEYDATPEIVPTLPEVLDENIKALLLEMQNGRIENDRS
jgi:hypothetical protein